MGTTAPFIATQPIYFGLTRGYNTGDVVPDDVVREHRLEDSVAREGTKAASAVLTDAQEG